ncbi:MAG: fumarylacetoacetate hydrolase family protein [Betaproteobacteria bacterium]
MKPEVIANVADTLLAAERGASMVAPVTEWLQDFDVDAAYAVLEVIASRRRAAGWVPVGRKIGFTNRTIWPRYGVDQPMWAHTWRQTVHNAHDGRAKLPMARFVQPRIEPEIVFGIAGPVPDTEDAEAILRAVDWIAAGFEVVQSHFPDWKFKVPDCTASFGLHGALVVGTPVRVTDANRAALARRLPIFEVTLRKNGRVVEVGIGANVLDSPALALAYLARVLAKQPSAPPLVAGEIITTGTITDAWPAVPGDVFVSDYDDLGVPGLELTLT